MALKLNSVNGSITLTPQDGVGTVVVTIPRAGFVTSLGDLGVTATSSELNYVAGATSAIQTQIDAKAPANNPTFTGTANAADMVLSGYLRGPSTFTIDPAAYGDNTGTVVIAGNLQVDGTTTTINSTTMTVDDINIVLASGAANAAAANGAGLTVDGASATILYASATDSWNFNKPISGTYTNLHPVPSIITTSIDFNAPVNTLTMSGATSFSESNKSEGKTTIFKLDRSATGHTPTFSANVKWSEATVPDWASNRYWVISMVCHDATNVFASATGHTI